MKAPDTGYECPSTLEQALACLASDTTEYQPLAGGQSLLPMMHLRLAQPEKLLDLNRIDELDFIREEDNHVHIGSMVRYSALASSSIVRQHVPLFTMALPHIAHSAIRNRGTIGGSTALADPAAEMPALLKSLDASINVVSSTGKRSIKADDFFLGIYDTALDESELVHSVSIPCAAATQRFGFYELARRHGDYAMAGVAISAQAINPLDGIRIVFFSVSDHAIRAPETETLLQGCDDLTEDILKQARQSLQTLHFQEDMNASSGTKAHLAGVVLQRALQGMLKEGGK